ncbi:MAG: DUF362 domain-containing protein [Treponema sp.]|nr:DUF362 domain-containing protein [Treponema sp.]
MKIGKKFGILILLLVLVMFTAAYTRRFADSVAVDVLPAPQAPAQHLPVGNISRIFVENSDGTGDGAARLFGSMRNHGLELHQTAASPAGLIARGDVVLLKINAQWDQRGGTNTDLLRGVIQEIVNHPYGFIGEIIVADNGQAHTAHAASGTRGSLDWPRSNAVDQTQSTRRVINDFRAGGYRITGLVWDDFTRTRVGEFSSGDMRDGFVMEDAVRHTGIMVSYPKFTTEFGTHVSFTYGIWNPANRTYNSEIFKVINMPVLKSHWTFHVTAAVKNYMGVPSNWLASPVGRPHNSVGTGGMGTLMAVTRMPVLNVLDMIWVAPEGGPRSLYNTAVQVNKIAASTDPVALDHWASREVLMPVAPARIRAPMSPHATEPGTFGHWLRLSMDELHRAGIWATMNESEMLVIGP